MVHVHGITTTTMATKAAQIPDLESAICLDTKHTLRWFNAWLDDIWKEVMANSPAHNGIETGKGPRCRYIPAKLLTALSSVFVLLQQGSCDDALHSHIEITYSLHLSMLHSG